MLDLGLRLQYSSRILGVRPRVVVFLGRGRQFVGVVGLGFRGSEGLRVWGIGFLLRVGGGAASGAGLCAALSSRRVFRCGFGTVRHGK